LEPGAFREPVTACLLLHHLLESSLFSRQISHSLLLRSDGFCCLPPCSVSVDFPSFPLVPAFVDMHCIPFHIIPSPLPAVLASPSTAFLPVVAPSLSLARLRVRCGPGSDTRWFAFARKAGTRMAGREYPERSHRKLSFFCYSAMEKWGGFSSQGMPRTNE